MQKKISVCISYC